MAYSNFQFWPFLPWNLDPLGPARLPCKPSFCLQRCCIGRYGLMVSQATSLGYELWRSAAAAVLPAANLHVLCTRTNLRDSPKTRGRWRTRARSPTHFRLEGNGSSTLTNARNGAGERLVWLVWRPAPVWVGALRPQGQHKCSTFNAAWMAAVSQLQHFCGQLANSSVPAATACRVA